MRRSLAPPRPTGPDEPVTAQVVAMHERAALYRLELTVSHEAPALAASRMSPAEPRSGAKIRIQSASRIADTTKKKAPGIR